MKRVMFMLVATFAAVSVYAQSASTLVGAVENVNGLVTISKGNTMSNGVDGAELANGTQVVTGAESSVLVRLTNGCVFTMPANSSVVINNQLPCADLIASIQTAGNTVAGAAVGADKIVFGIAVGLAALEILSVR
jgi:hypothetical protein